MSISITEYGLNNFGTEISNYLSIMPVFNIVSLQPNQINFSVNYQGIDYQIITKGTFDNKLLNLVPQTLDDILKSGLYTNVTNFYLMGPNNPFFLWTATPGITLTSAFGMLRGESLADFAPLNGDDTYFTNSEKKDVAIYLYDGNDTIYQNHLLSKYNDLMYGGSGFDLLIFQGNSSGFYISYSNNIWDDLTSKSNLEGFIIKDNNGIINTTQINQIEKIQFADKSIDLTPYISSAHKGVTIQFNGSHTISTAYYPDDTGAPPADQIKITKFTNTEIGFSATTSEGINFSGIFYGLFDILSYSKSPVTLVDILNKGSSLLVQKFTIDLPSENVRTETYSKAVTFDDFWTWTNGRNNNVYLNFLGGDDTFITSNNGNDTSALPAYGYDGNDRFIEKQKLIKYNDIFYGGNGIDTAIYQFKSSNFSITSSNTIWDDQAQKSNLIGFIISDNTKAINTLQINQVEGIQFSDFTIDTTSLTKTAALSHSNVVNLVELYIASFNRAPDSVGLYYWGGRLSDGMSLEQIAKSFFTQKETIAAYPSGMATKDFVTTVYNNVLSRGPDTDGLNYWVGQLDKGIVSKDSFLLAIINGAMAASGSAVDRQTLANKEAVGEHYAIYQGLNNSNYWAKDVMSGVTDQMATVTAANAKADGYAAIAANPATSDLVVKLVGVAV